MKPLLILRPEPGASSTAAKARALGLDPMIAPLFEIRAIDWAAPDAGGYDAVLLTSANALRFGGEQLARLHSLPAYTVGAATAEAARDAGYTVVGVGDGGVDALLATIEPGLRLLHLCGEERNEPTDPSRSVRTIPVYRSQLLGHWRPETLQDIVALIHSPRSGRKFACKIDELKADRGAIAIAAMSAAAADAVGPNWCSIDIAPKPGDDPLLALAARLCDTRRGE